MAIRVARVLEVASAITQIASYLGLPIAVVAGAVAGVVAITGKLTVFEGILIALFVLTCVLQSAMAAVLLIDRVFEKRREVETANAAIAYHLTPVAHALIRDPGNKDAEFQLRVKIYNGSGYPLRYHMISTRAVIEDRQTPELPHNNYVPGIMPSGGITEVRFHSYRAGLLPREGILRGRVEMVYRYGHASAEDFAFESHRVYSLKAGMLDDPKQRIIAVEFVVVSERDEPIVKSTFRKSLDGG
jgi:hypothetical protein